MNYTELLTKFSPRPIKSDVELQMTIAVTHSLLDKPSLTPDEKDFLGLLGILIKEYEDKLEFPDIYGVEMLKALIAERPLSQEEIVDIFGNVNYMNEVLAGKELAFIFFEEKNPDPIFKNNFKHLDPIEKLAKLYNVSPAVFFPQS